MMIVGLDLSLTGTGISRLGITPTGKHALQLDTLTSTPAGTDYADRSDRLERLRHGIVTTTVPTDLVVVEGPAYSRGASAGTWDRAGLWWLVYTWLHDSAPVAVVPPSSLKKYATGRGNATKADMRVALLQRLDRDERDDNAVDAAWLALMGADWLGQPVVGLPRSHTDALAKVAWPAPCGAEPDTVHLMDGAVS